MMDNCIGSSLMYQWQVHGQSNIAHAVDLDKGAVGIGESQGHVSNGQGKQGHEETMFFVAKHGVCKEAPDKAEQKDLE